MITISLCMIVRDEEATIARCLDSVKDIADEIIVVDTGSVDLTKEIVKQFTSNIYDFEWIDDFSAARNYSFSKATKDYILWLDADDVLLEEDREKFMHLKNALDPSTDIVMMKYNLGADNEGRPFCTYYRERLLKREKNFTWEDPIHEYITPSGKIFKADIAISHRKIKQRSSRNLKIFEKMVGNGQELSHRNHFYFARELSSNGRLEEAITHYETFLEKDGGLISNYLDTCIDLSKIYTQKGDRKSAIRALLRSFEFGPPRGEICCELGCHFKELKKYEDAISWYEVATKLPLPTTLGAVIHDCYNYIPLAELSVCYFRLGRVQEAVLYNEKAAQFKPNSAVIINNRKYYESIIQSVIGMK